MKAIVVERPGTPDVLQFRTVSTPQLRPGWVLIRVKAFGLNRSEMFTRQGHSPDVKFPRILGIECVGVVEAAAAPDTDIMVGQPVAALMGGMGRQYDGSYAEYTLVPSNQVIPLKNNDISKNISWEMLAAIPETFLTAWGSLVEAMDVKSGQTILVRGGTSSVRMAAISIAKQLVLTVVATTRNKNKIDALRNNGADYVIIDNGQIASEAKQLLSGINGSSGGTGDNDGMNYVLELVGTVTLLDSLQAAAAKGIVCDTGSLGNEWTIKNFEPRVAIPSTVKLTVYNSETITAANSAKALEHVIDGVANGRYHLNIDKVFSFEEIVEAHHYMEENRSKGKLVVKVEQ
jgi:NADPH:quinone reductase